MAKTFKVTKPKYVVIMYDGNKLGKILSRKPNGVEVLGQGMTFSLAKELQKKHRGSTISYDRKESNEQQSQES